MVNYEFLTTTGPFVFMYMLSVFVAAQISVAFRLYLHINELCFFLNSHCSPLNKKIPARRIRVILHEKEEIALQAPFCLQNGHTNCSCWHTAVIWIRCVKHNFQLIAQVLFNPFCWGQVCQYPQRKRKIKQPKPILTACTLLVIIPWLGNGNSSAYSHCNYWRV